MFSADDFIASQKSLMQDETIYIKEFQRFVLVYYKHYKDNSMIVILRDKDEINVFRNGTNILGFHKANAKEGVKVINDLLTTFAVYIAINYDSKKTIEEIEDLSSSNTTKDAFTGLFWVETIDLEIFFEGVYRIKKSE